MFRKIVKAFIPRTIFAFIEPYGHLAESVFWQTLYGFPARGLKVIGVTGTDGKTTTSTMIFTMLSEAGLKTGLMTTIGYGVRGHWRDNYVHMTTMPTRAMLLRIKELKSEGIEWLVLETTSHALAQNRVWGIPYSIGVMTNVTHEHLEYHRTFSRYRLAKVKLFDYVARNRSGYMTGILNHDDPSAQYFAEAVPKSVSYGLGGGDLMPANVTSTPKSSSYHLKTKNRTLNIKVNLPGEFNISNSLAAVGVGMTVGLTDGQIEQGIAALLRVDGRMNTIEEGQDFTAIVDFAHTPESFEKILTGLRKSTPGKLIVVFGSAGRRDAQKRPLQGKLAGKLADLVVLTEEDDRDEDGREILAQIASGAVIAGKREKKDLFLIADRVDAITFAINQARKGDTVVFLGKGHEKTIARKDGEHSWDESAQVRRAVQNSLKSKE